MNNQILNGNSDTYYVVVVDGKKLPQRFVNSLLAEAHISTLDDDVKENAHVLPVNGDGQQVLLG